LQKALKYLFSANKELNDFFDIESTVLDPEDFYKKSTFKSDGCNVVIIDLPNMEKRLLEYNPDFFIKVVFDDLGGLILNTDILINPSSHPGYHDYRYLNDNTLKCFGVKFVPPRKAFSIQKDRSLNSNKVGVIIGSSDKSLKWLRVISDLAQLNKKIFFEVVVSPNFCNSAEVQHLFYYKNIKLLTSLNDNELCDFLRSVRLSILTAGMCLYESLAVGTPTIAYPILEFMVDEASFFESEKIITNVKQNGFDILYLNHKLKKLYDNEEKLSYLSEAGQAAVDAHGVNRIKRIILGCLTL